MDVLWSLGKIAVGTSQVIGGILTATGHGVVGTMCNQFHCMPAAMKLGSEQVKKGTKKIEEGVNELF